MPFSGRCAARLEQLAGLPDGGLPAAFQLVNLLASFPGKAGKGDLFPLPAAKAAAARLAPTLPETVLLAGRGVAAAFGFRDLPYLMWAAGTVRRVAVLPHPSGVNHWWNCSANRRRAAIFMQAAKEGGGDERRPARRRRAREGR